MKVPIRRFDKELPLPEYKTAGAAAMDCYVREGTTIAPGAVEIVPLNMAIQPPRGHFVLMAPRSSMFKRGLKMANDVGIFDEDYCGNNDEYRLVLHNFTKEPVTVEKGDRLAQIIVLPFDRVEWEEVDSLKNENRGGLGTTGT